VSVLNNLRAVQKFPILCYVTDRKNLPPSAPLASSAALAEKIGMLAAAGVDWVQIREKDLPARELAALAREALRRCTRAQADPDPRPTRILINDRVDLALTHGAAGVHLGESSLPVHEVKRLIRSRASGRDFLIGVSCHTLEGAKSAATGGADYLLFGPIFPTPSKAAFGEPQGVARLAEICGSLTIPVLAIGGITLENAGACFRAGAAGIAAIRLFQDAPDPGAAVQALRQSRR
jgi:thiamine-phosphate pyrophosphorylase